jgi:hypothetical protein
MASGMTEQQAKEMFIYNFNFAQPPAPDSSYLHGTSIHFNKDGIRALINSLAPENSSLDMNNYANHLSTAGQWLEKYFPTDPFILQSTHNEIMRHALEAGAAASRSGILENAIVGSAIGFGSHIATARIAGDIRKSGHEEESGGGGEQAQVQARPQAGQQEAAPAQGAEQEAQVQAQEQEQNLDPRFDWSDLFETNRVTFTENAAVALGKTQTKTWEQMTVNEKTNIVELINFISTYNERRLRFKIRLRCYGANYNIASNPTMENPILGLESADAGNRNFDFTNANETWPYPVILERPANDQADPTIIPQGIATIDRIRFEFGEARALRRQIKIEISRQRRNNQNRQQGQNRQAVQYQNVFQGDDGRGILEVVGVNAAGDKARVLMPNRRVVEITQTDLNNIFNLKVYHWGEGGPDVDGQYTER